MPPEPQLFTPAVNNRLSNMNVDGEVEQKQNTVTPNVGPSKKPLFQPRGGGMSKPITVSAQKPPAVNLSASKPPGGAGLFKKPNVMGIGKKKFQMEQAAPDENQLQQINKVQTKLLAP